MFDFNLDISYSYKNKNKSIKRKTGSISRDTPAKKSRDELIQWLKENNARKNKEKKRSRAAVRIQKRYRAFACFKQLRALMRLEWDAEIHRGSVTPQHLAYMIGTLLFFFDEDNAKDHHRLLALARLILQLNDRTPSYWHLCTDGFAGSMWTGLVWQQQVVALVSLCIKGEAVRAFPSDVMNRLLQSFVSPDSWPVDLQEQAVNVTVRLGICLSGLHDHVELSGIGCKFSWIHPHGAMVIDGAYCALKTAAEEVTGSRDMQRDELLVTYVDIACKAILQCDRALLDGGRFESLLNVVEQVCCLLAGNPSVFNHPGITGMLTRCSSRLWQSCLEQCKHRLDTLAPTQVGALVAHIITIYQNRRDTYTNCIRTFWDLINHGVSKIPCFASSEETWEAVSSGGEEQESGPVSTEYIRMHKCIRPVLRRRFSPMRLLICARECQSEWEKVRQRMALLRSRTFVLHEACKALDVANNRFDVLLVFGASLEQLREQRNWPNVSEGDGDGNFNVRDLTFHRQARPLLREMWNHTLNSINPKRRLRFSTDESRCLTFLCASTKHVFHELYDDEIFGQSGPFTLEQVSRLSMFVRELLIILVWRGDETRSRGFSEHESSHNTSEPLKHVAIQLYRALYDCDVRREIMPTVQWLFPPIPQNELRSVVSTLRVEDENGGDPQNTETAREPPASNARGNPSARANEMIRLLPQAVSFEQRVFMLRRTLSRHPFNPRRRRQLMRHRTRFRGERLFEDSFLALGHDLQRLQLRLRTTIVWTEAERPRHRLGYSQFITAFMNEVFAEEFGLFAKTKDGLLYPCLRFMVHRKLEKYRFIGAMLAKAVRERSVVEHHFAPFFLNTLLGRTNTFNDLRSYDDQIYQDLLVLKSIADPESFNLTFVEPSTGVPLGRGGDSRAVTKDNRHEYITRRTDYLLNKQFRYATTAFINGFSIVLQPSLLQMFSSRELQMAISRPVRRRRIIRRDTRRRLLEQLTQ